MITADIPPRQVEIRTLCIKYKKRQKKKSVRSLQAECAVWGHIPDNRMGAKPKCFCCRKKLKIKG